ncbi:MAG: stage II sporulation protein M [Chloroflexia bacterium]
MIDRFVADRKARWERLSHLLTRTSSFRRSRLTAAEVEEFGRLYREASSDLARARRDFPRSQTTLYLNSLVGRAHRQVYLPREASSDENPIRRFFGEEFPRTFRRNGRLVLIAFLVFFVPALLAYGLSMWSPEASAVLAPQGIASRIEEVRETGRWADISAGESSLAASTIMTNNIRVAILAFAGGVLIGIPTVLVLALNGLMLGSVVAVAQQGGVGVELWSFVSPHGWIELTIIFIAGGAGLGLGRAILLPGLFSRADALTAAALDSVRLLLGGAALLVIAGTIEGFVSPSLIPPAFKFGFGLVTAVALFSYLFLAGRETSAESPYGRTWGAARAPRPPVGRPRLRTLSPTARHPFRR